ncbi:redox-sensing transcriptional repressor Rex [bacterium]|nr:redox-sensing transcriptional repressor Rex [bacterium]
MKRQIPTITVQRLPVYLHCLEGLDSSVGNISSDELATAAGVKASKLRKDLSYLGSYGTRGVGYDVQHLAFQIRAALGLNREWSVVIVGAGNLGRALANFDGFADTGFQIVGVFDVDPDKVGETVSGLSVEHIDDLAAAIIERSVSIGVIATPPKGAQQAADLLSGSGVRSILNFAPTVVKKPDGVYVRRVDLSSELQVLSFFLHRHSEDAEAGASEDG